jgi:apolipoprotein N-acyltransferase
MVFGEQVLISGKQTVDRTIAYFFVSVLAASAWLGVDFLLIDPQVSGLIKVLLLPVVLIIVAGVLYYCAVRLRRFAKTIEDV